MAGRALNILILFIMNIMITKVFKLLFLNEISEDNLTLLEENESIEKKNYILLILILIILIAGLGGLYYYQLQETIPDILNSLKNCVDEQTYLQIKHVVNEILVKPNKKLLGLELLKLMKLIVQPHRISNTDQFYKCIDKLIKIIDKDNNN